MKKLFAAILFLITLNAYSQAPANPITISNRANNPVNSQDSIGYNYTGKAGGWSWWYNAEYIRTHFAPIAGGGYVPYTGATTNVNLGSHTLTALTLIGNLNNSLTNGFGISALSFNNSAPSIVKADTTTLQTVGNFFTLGNTKYYTKVGSDARFAPIITYTSNAIYKGNGTTTPVVSSITDNGTTVSSTEAITSAAALTAGTYLKAGNLFAGKASSILGGSASDGVINVLGANKLQFAIDQVVRAEIGPDTSKVYNNLKLANTVTGSVGDSLLTLGANSVVKKIAGSSYAPYSTQYYTVQQDITAPEIQIDSLTETGYNNAQVLVQTKSGKYLMWYRRGTSHTSSSEFVYLRSSTDGKIWSSPTSVTTGGGGGGGVTQTGRVIISYTKKITAGRYDAMFIYSDDDGTTWSTPALIADSTVAYGKMIVAGNGLLVLPLYHDSPNILAQVTTSSDNGLTWSTPSTITTTPNLGLDNETSIAYLGGNTIVAICRTLSGAFDQYISNDNGSTWTFQGLSSFDTGTQVTPELSVYLSPSGRRMVTLYYANRGVNYIKTVTSSALDLINNGTSGWNSSTVVNVTANTGTVGFGYPSVVHPNNSAYALGIYYIELSSSSTHTHFFTDAPRIALGTPSSGVITNLSGTCAGCSIGGNAATATTAITATNFSGSLSGDVTGTQSATVVGKINGVSLAGLATGIYKNTTGTGAPSIAVAGTDYAAPNQIMFIGTTSVAINRASGTLNLAGIGSIAMSSSLNGVTSISQSGPTANTMTNNVLIYGASAIATGYKYMQIANGNGGTLQWGLAATNGTFAGGTKPNMAVFGNASNASVGFLTNNTVRDSIDKSGINWWVVAPNTASGSYSTIVRDNSTGEMQTTSAVLVGQATLTAGVATITISGLTTSSIATTGFVAIGGTVGTTWQYQAVCTANTLTITAITSAGATDITDTSIINYSVKP